VGPEKAVGKENRMFRLGMIHKLVLINIIVFLVFGMIVLAVLFLFRNIEGLSKNLIDNNFNLVISNAQLGRDINKALADTDLFVATFLFGKKDVLRDGTRIVAAAEALEAKSSTPHLQQCLHHLTGQLSLLVQQCVLVRDYSEKLESRESKLDKSLTGLEQTLSEKLISRVMEGKDASIMEQLSIIIPGYREALLQISLEHMKLGLHRDARHDADRGRRLLAQLDDFHLRLRTLTASEPEIAVYGPRLMGDVTAYKRETKIFVEAVSTLEEQLLRLDGLKRHLLDDMRKIDGQAAAVSGSTLRRVTDTMGSSSTFIVSISAAVIALLCFFTVSFILVNIRRPMKLIRQGIDAIRRGELDTRIQLERRDEWSVIEHALNDMVADLQTSYGELKGMNSDLITARSALQEKVRELESQFGERERAEAELKTSEEKWHSLYENLPGGSFTVNDNYIIEDVNDVLCAVTGFTRAELVGQRCGIICPKGPHKCPIFDLGKERIDNNETAVKAKDGRLVPIIKSARRIPFGNSDVIVENFQDITDRKHLEEQLHHARKMEAVGQLAGGVAHDFNNILTAIIGYGTLLQMGFPEGDPSRAKVDQILGAAERAAELTRSLLTLSRKRVVELQPLLLNDCVSEMKGLLSRLIREDIEFRTDIAVEPLTVMGDKTQMEQILINLVTNARDSMPDGGVVTLRLTLLEMDEGFVGNRGFGNPGRYAVLTVGDTGFGMDEETRERIFEPFYTTKAMGKGTGLGLAIVYGIAQQHNGFVEVLSAPGEGSTFHVYLPLAEAACSAIEIVAEAETLQGTETILLAEDEEAVRELVRSVLEDSGYRVLAAHNGMEAVEKFSEHGGRIDLLVFDVIMPKMNGKDAYDQIRKEAPGVRALFMSGYTGDILNNKGIIDEGLSFIAKPVAPGQLLRKIRTILDT
jgi:PAS domain S-box-containing protein